MTDKADTVFQMIPLVGGKFNGITSCLKFLQKAINGLMSKNVLRGNKEDMLEWLKKEMQRSFVDACLILQTSQMDTSLAYQEYLLDLIKTHSTLTEVSFIASSNRRCHSHPQYFLAFCLSRFRKQCKQDQGEKGGCKEDGEPEWIIMWRNESWFCAEDVVSVRILLTMFFNLYYNRQETSLEELNRRGDREMFEECVEGIPMLVLNNDLNILYDSLEQSHLKLSQNQSFLDWLCLRTHPDKLAKVLGAMRRKFTEKPVSFSSLCKMQLKTDEGDPFEDYMILAQHLGTKWLVIFLQAGFQGNELVHGSHVEGGEQVQMALSALETEARLLAEVSHGKFSLKNH